MPKEWVNIVDFKGMESNKDSSDLDGNKATLLLNAKHNAPDGLLEPSNTHKTLGYQQFIRKGTWVYIDNKKYFIYVNASNEIIISFGPEAGGVTVGSMGNAVTPSIDTFGNHISISTGSETLPIYVGKKTLTDGLLGDADFDSDIIFSEDFISGLTTLYNIDKMIPIASSGNTLKLIGYRRGFDRIVFFEYNGTTSSVTLSSRIHRGIFTLSSDIDVENIYIVTADNITNVDTKTDNTTNPLQPFALHSISIEDNIYDADVFANNLLKDAGYSYIRFSYTREDVVRNMIVKDAVIADIAISLNKIYFLFVQDSIVSPNVIDPDTAKSTQYDYLFAINLDIFNDSDNRIISDLIKIKRSLIPFYAVPKRTFTASASLVSNGGNVGDFKTSHSDVPGNTIINTEDIIRSFFSTGFVAQNFDTGTTNKYFLFPGLDGIKNADSVSLLPHITVLTSVLGSPELVGIYGKVDGGGAYIPANLIKQQDSQCPDNETLPMQHNGGIIFHSKTSGGSHMLVHKINSSYIQPTPISPTNKMFVGGYVMFTWSGESRGDGELKTSPFRNPDASGGDDIIFYLGDILPIRKYFDYPPEMGTVGDRSVAKRYCLPLRHLVGGIGHASLHNILSVNKYAVPLTDYSTTNSLCTILEKSYGDIVCFDIKHGKIISGAQDGAVQYSHYADNSKYYNILGSLPASDELNNMQVSDTIIIDSDNFALINGNANGSNFGKYLLEWNSDTNKYIYTDASEILIDIVDISFEFVGIGELDTADPTTKPFVMGGSYAYRISLLYDSFQESPLNDLPSVFISRTQDPLPVDNNYSGVEITITIPETVFKTLSKRVTHLNIYYAPYDEARGDVEGFYRFVKSIPLKSSALSEGTDVVTGTPTYTAVIEDYGRRLASYEAVTGHSETIKKMSVQRKLQCALDGYLFIADIKIDEDTKHSNMIIRSQQGQFSIFDYANNFALLPFTPIAMVTWNGRIFLFGEESWCIVNPASLQVEKTSNEFPITEAAHVLSTDMGVFIYSNKRLYLLSNEANNIGLHIENGGDVNLSLFTKIRMYYSSKHNMLMVFGDINGRLWMFGFANGIWYLYDVTKLTTNESKLIIRNFDIYTDDLDPVVSVLSEDIDAQTSEV